MQDLLAYENAENSVNVSIDDRKSVKEQKTPEKEVLKEMKQGKEGWVSSRNNTKRSRRHVEAKLPGVCGTLAIRKYNKRESKKSYWRNKEEQKSKEIKELGWWISCIVLRERCYKDNQHNGKYLTTECL